MAWLKAVTLNLFILLSATLLALLLGEVLLRWVEPQQLIVMNQDIWRPDEQLGWRHHENARTQINSGERLVQFVTDQNGFRINHDALTRPEIPPALNVLVIGDSYIEAIQVENRQTIPGLLQDRMSRLFEQEIRFTNDSVGAWTPNQYLKEAKLALERHDFDMGIVFLYAGNDIVSDRLSEFSPQQVAAHHSLHWPKEWTYRGLLDAIAYPLNDFFETRSHLFIFLKTRFQTVLARMGLTARRFPDVFDVAQRKSKRWQTTTDICSDIKREFEKRDLEVLFVMLPASYQVHQHEFLAFAEMFDLNPASIDLDQPNRLLAEHFSRQSLILLDPLSFLRARADEGEVFYGSIDKHFNPQGHISVAEFLSPYVESAIRDALKKKNAAIVQGRKNVE